MIRIAICDDDKTTTTIIEEMLCKIGKEQNLKIECGIFFDGSTLVEHIRQGTYYDLIYLDIEMKNVNGISAAEVIREMGIPALIIYVSNYEKYLKELFNTEPFRFLSKPIDPDIFQSVFLAAYKRIRQRAEYFSFTYNKTLVKIPLSRIHYFESSNRVIYIHLAGNFKSENPEFNRGEHKFYGKMNDIEAKLSYSNSRFIRIHQSYLVNFDYIKSMDFYTITMSDGTTLQISEDRQKNVRTQFCTMSRIEVPRNE